MGTARGALVAGLIASAALAGCGGSDSTDANSISRAAFIKKADAICEKSNERLGTAFVSSLKKNKGVKKPSNAEYEKLVGTVMVPNVKKEIEELKALGAPDGDEDRIDAMIETLEEGVEIAERDPKAVVISSDAVFGIASRLAGEYGLEVCGSR
jgi:hypothetical protein